MNTAIYWEGQYRIAQYRMRDMFPAYDKRGNPARWFVQIIGNPTIDIGDSSTLAGAMAIVKDDKAARMNARKVQS
jgi:hypothetical protein